MFKEDWTIAYSLTAFNVHALAAGASHGRLKILKKKVFMLTPCRYRLKLNFYLN